MNSNLRGLIRLGRSGGLSREKILTSLKAAGVKAREANPILDEVFGEDFAKLDAEVTAGIETVLPELKGGAGKEVDESGRDAADRATMDLLQVLSTEE